MDVGSINKLMQSNEPLLPELEPYVRHDEGLGMKVFHHPLIIDVPFMHPALVNARYKFKKAKLEKYIAEGNYDGAIALTERPYRTDLLLKLKPKMDRKAFLSSVAYVWIDSENIHENQRVWRNVWRSVSPSDWDSLHDERSLKALNALPDIVTVYRGVGLEEAKRGMSWTTDVKKAEWFASRNANLADPELDAEPILITGEVKKQDIAAHFLNRGESEVVVLPEKVSVVFTEALG